MLHNQKEETPSYGDLFVVFSCSVEKWLKRVITILFLTLIVFQLLMKSTEIRYYLTTIGKLEGMT
ncbi:MAG: hypothetical protein WD907_01255 [Bacilli bacterium]